MSNTVQKEYCVKIKLKALDWQWVTMISWCQINCLGHNFPVMHKIKSKTHIIFGEFKGNIWKINLFLWNIFRFPVLTPYFLLIQMIIPYRCLTSYLSCLCSTTVHSVVLLLFWVVQVKMQKTIASCWFHKKFNLLEKFDFWPLL